MKKGFFLLLILGLGHTSFAQRGERGKILRAPKIFQKKKTPTPEQEKVEDSNFKNKSFQNEVDFQFEEEPRLRFSNSFETKEVPFKAPSSFEGSDALGESLIKTEPIRRLNENIHEDTSSIDEGELMIVEIEEYIRFSGRDEMVKSQEYFTIWNNNYVNPYGINPRNFQGVVPLKLYDISKGRYWTPPLDACPITSNFKWRRGRWHKGTDIDLITGDPVYAVFDGIIRISNYVRGGYGRYIVIRHYNGLETVYGHMSKLNFPINTEVKAGDIIGLGGNTGRSSGSHLHFETRYEGTAFDAGNIFDFKRGETKIKMQEFLMTKQMYNYLRGGSPRVALRDVDASISTMDTGITPDDDEIEDDFEEDVPEEVNQIVWYRIRSGDTLTKIARSFKTTVSEICELNKISSYKKLYVGNRLRVK